MRKSDIEIILDIERSSNPHPWAKKNFLDCLERDYYCLVQEIQKEVSGFAIQSIAIDESHLLNIGIKKKYRRKGFGEEILNQIILFSKVMGCRKIFLEVRISNIRAIKLYEKEGFRKVDIRKNYYKLREGREDALIMVKRLRDNWKTLLFGDRL
tara:strand:- start:1118 stop:1579 length:462 start_codon:yes stop_codon:yes gene_type:complete